jgi:ankyrin repeat protein
VRALALVVVLVAAACAAPTPIQSTPGDTVTDLRLHQAAAGGDLAVIAALLEAGLPIDARDADGRTPVMAATVARQTAAVRALVEAGADVDIRDNRLDNPFLYAGAEGLLDILRLVNEAGADPAITNRYGGIALIPACERGHVDVVRYLLDESDVDVDHVNNLGWTGLLEAIILADGDAAHQEIVRLLLEHGADPELADRDGVTPLAHARAKGQAAIAALLEAAGATR